MEKSALINSDVNYDWNFLNYPIHTIFAKPEQTSKELAIEYAKKNKIDFEVIEPNKRKITLKSYADNFTK